MMAIWVEMNPATQLGFLERIRDTDTSLSPEMRSWVVRVIDRYEIALRDKTDASHSADH
jgi:hypothetical protein